MVAAAYAFCRPARWLPLAGLLLPGNPLNAQRPNRVELGLVAGLHLYDSQTDLASALGLAGRVGYWIYGPLSLEGEVSYARPRTDTPLKERVGTTTFAGWVLANQRVGPSGSVFLKGGYGSVSYGRCPSAPVPGSGPCGSAGVLLGGVGARVALSPLILVRTDLSVNRSVTSLKFSNVTFQAGLSLMPGSKPPVDADADRIPDRSDRCAGTPRGVQVDSRGCPSDQDRDGVPDELDRCPASPPGARIDHRGCTGDSDGDGVPDGLDRCGDTPRGATVDARGCPSDADRDGVPDGVDRCPDNRPGATVDATGCASDADLDGVLDRLDRCPGTRAGAAVDATGCPRDADRDGVPDGPDRCPGTLAGAAVDAAGCPVDADRDGVADGLDRCPDTPAGAAVDARGCPGDADGDGVPNGLDRCQATPAGTAVDAAGCPVPKPPAAPAAGPRSWVLPGAVWPYRGAVLGAQAFPVLDSVVAMLKADPRAVVEIDAHAMDQLPPAEEIRLSQFRAEAVRAYLTFRGVLVSRITARGRGSSFPLDPANTEIARITNRRVEIRIIRKTN